ncbi:MAG TPA: UvrB/UvrC motif-containing protein, partial [Candidatus Limnocylindrales bacterium]|nr:UvrB/UvrC motif-containing protein [Candidatus Limnocylindrales bacterium]
RMGIYDVIVGINLLREGIDLPEVTLVAILDADKEGFLRSAWSLIQMVGRAARNIGGEVVMYADTITESMRVAIDETDRRRAVQERYNAEHGIEPTTIVKGIRDINERLRTVAESTVVYTSERDHLVERALTTENTRAIEKLLSQMESEMRAAAKQLEFERAAALRDEIQQIRLRVLEQDQSLIVGRAAERAAEDVRRSKRPGERRPDPERDVVRVTEVTVVPVEEDLVSAGGATASDWLPGIRDEHEDDGGWQARWLERPTWDTSVTPNIRKRTGQRPVRSGRRRGY